MNPDTLNVITSADWGERGQTATVLAILLTLCVLNARRATRKIVETEDATERPEAIPQHPANRIIRSGL